MDHVVDLEPADHRERLEELRRGGEAFRRRDPRRAVHALRLVPPLRRSDRRPGTRARAGRGSPEDTRARLDELQAQTRARLPARRSTTRSSTASAVEARNEIPARHPQELIDGFAMDVEGRRLRDARGHARLLLPRRRRGRRDDGDRHGCAKATRSIGPPISAWPSSSPTSRATSWTTPRSVASTSRHEWLTEAGVPRLTTSGHRATGPRSSR